MPASPDFREPIMRSVISRYAARAALAVAMLTSVNAGAQTTIEPPVTCAALTVTGPAKLIESCTAVIDNPATADADRLDAMIARAAALHGSGQTGKALAEIDAVLQDYSEAVRLNPSDKTAAANYQEIGQEMERLGALVAQKNLPSFNCATAKRPVEKAICADPGLAQLDRNINDVFLRVIASAESDSHRAALALTRQQRDFIGKRNASFGRRGYDLRQAMEQRLDKLNAIARQ